MTAKGRRITTFFIVATVIILPVVFLSRQAHAATMPATSQGEIIDSGMAGQAGEYQSSVLPTDFSFTVVGFAWQGSASSIIAARFYTNGGWSVWYSPESMDTVEQEGWQYITEPIVTKPANRIQYRLESSTGIDRVKVVYIDSSESKHLGKLNIVGSVFSQAPAQSDLPVIPRSGWQADESWRLNVAGGEVWPAGYQWPEKFVIHHTAGDDGGANPAAVVRGIYFWHAKVLGWGDIGYNYLIDQQGNIYEGRYGGDGVIGAHVYRSKACAEQRFGGPQYEANFNKGTIGIAVLGDYENIETMNAAVQTALVNLISHKAKDFDIQPTGSSFFFDAVYPNIVGHKDLDCTTCPGKNLYTVLPTIREQAQAEFATLGGITDPVIKPTYVSQSEQPITVNTGETKEVWVDFRNDGNVTWRNYKSSTLAVVAQNPVSSFYVAGWDSTTEAAKLTTPNVAPGEIGRFVFNVKAPADHVDVVENFSLQFSGQPIPATDFTVHAQITGLPYAGSLDSQTIRPATFTGARQTVILKFRNRGLQPWKKGEVSLDISDLGGSQSRFYDPSWSAKTGHVTFTEAEVKTNELATFTIVLKSPATPGRFLNQYHLAGHDIVQTDAYTITRVDSTTQAQLITQTVPLAVRTTWRPKITVKFKNTGLTVWDRNTVLKVYDAGSAVSRFKDRMWPDNFIAARLTERTVKPGQAGTFTFYFKSPSAVGLYRNTFALFRGTTAVQGGSFELLTRVDK